MVINLIKKLLRYKNRQYFKKYALIDITSDVRNAQLQLKNPINRKYLMIGSDCIVAGKFIFESESGKVEIGNHSFIGTSTFISHSKISIGNNVTIAWGCTIYDHDSHSLDYMKRRKDIDDELNDIRNGIDFIHNKDWRDVKSKPIRICDDVWIGMNVIILKGVTIGEGAVVGAGSVVVRDVPAWTVVAGNPAKNIKKLK